MQRNIIIGVVGMVLLVGIGFFLMKGKPNPNDVASDAPTSVSSEAAESVVPVEQKSLIGNALDAFRSGKKMKCSVRDTENGSETAFYSEGKKFKSSVIMNDVGYVTIFDGTTYYSWDEKTKQGMKFTESCMKEFTDQFAKNAPKDAPAQSNPADTPEEVLKDAANTSCESVDSVDFSVPSTITFMDQCIAMKQTQDMLKNIGGAGSGIPDLSKMNIPGYPEQQ